ncbi:MAG TPA: hypothetical protein VL737_04540 [Candidatus Pristimantibacillus sp.]|jgi:hypothetical protein|nr:hypothetical protein [Candidatus Pristimantibacillus sp.]
MAEALDPPRAEILFTNLNLPEGYALPDNLFGRGAARLLGVGAAQGSVDAHREMLGIINEGSGVNPRFAGYDLTPTRALARAMDKDGFINRIDPEDPGSGQLFVAAEQSWGPGIPAGLRQSAKRRSPAPIALSTAMPDMHKSLGFLARHLPEVPLTYCDDEGAFGRWTQDETYPFIEAGPQIKLESFLKLLRADKNGLPPSKPYEFDDNGLYVHYAGASDVATTLQSLGAQGVVIDTHWLQSASPDGRRLDPNTVLNGLSLFKTPVLRAHAAAGRIDPGTTNPDDRKRTMKDLKAVLDGPDAIARSSLGQVLGWSFAIWTEQGKDSLQPQHRHPFLVSFQTPYAGLAAAREIEGKSMSPADYLAMTRDAGDNLGNFLNGINLGDYPTQMPRQ